MLTILQIFKINGFCRIEDNQRVLYETDDTKFLLTENPDEFCMHAERSGALNYLMFCGLGEIKCLSEKEERVNHVIDEIKYERKEKHGDGIFLVARKKYSYQPTEEPILFDMKNYSAVLQEFDIEKYNTDFRLSTENMLIALSFQFIDSSDYKISCVSRSRFLTINGKPAYLSRITGGRPRIIQNVPFRKEGCIETNKLFQNLLSDPSLKNVYKLMVASRNADISQLEEFLCIWAAIEMFIVKAFSTYYEKTWSQYRLTHKKTLERKFNWLNKTPSEKYGTKIKFQIIATLLHAPDMDNDIKKFNKLSAYRNRFYHNFDPDEPDYPIVEEMQVFLRKYLLRHAQKQQSKLAA